MDKTKRDDCGNRSLSRSKDKAAHSYGGRKQKVETMYGLLVQLIFILYMECIIASI